MKLIDVLSTLSTDIVEELENLVPRIEPSEGRQPSVVSLAAQEVRELRVANLDEDIVQLDGSDSTIGR